MSAPEHYLYSSYREKLLEHLFAGEVMSHLWRRGFRKLEMLKSHVDDSGYDLVLEANTIVRHIQLKSSHSSAATARVNVSLDLATKPSGCIVWMRFDADSLALGPFMWFGNEPGEPLPDIRSFKIAKHTKANVEGVKLERPNMRVVPVKKFERLDTLAVLVARLFGEWPMAKPIP